jgi:hypothetical protein
MRNIYTILVEKTERNYRLGDPVVRDRIILKWILEKQGVRMWTGINWVRSRSSGSEHGMKIKESQ